MLKLERQYASTEIMAEPTLSFSESKDVESSGEPVADPGQGFTEPGDTGSSNHKSWDRLPKAGSKADVLMKMAKRAAERGADKRRRYLESSLSQPRGNSHQ